MKIKPIEKIRFERELRAGSFLNTIINGENQRIKEIVFKKLDFFKISLLSHLCEMRYPLSLFLKNENVNSIEELYFRNNPNAFEGIRDFNKELEKWKREERNRSDEEILKLEGVKNDGGF